jgi:Ketopantoate reductase PanE/ApbA
MVQKALRLKILIVGAGALGQVFGFHLYVAGASVSYLVKPARVPAVRTGFRLYRHVRRGQTDTLDFVVHDVLSDPVQAGESTWNAVWLCVPSTALHEPSVAQLRGRVGAATIVTIGQGVRDRATLEKIWPKEQIVEITPNVFAYHAPLGNETLPAPGVAFWIPPGEFAIAGAADRVNPLMAAMVQGGLKTKYIGIQGKGDMMAALTMPYMAALEAADWSMPRLRNQLGLAAGAAREAAHAVAAARRIPPPGRIATSSWTARLALAMFPRMAPFDLERYMQVHFKKVSVQTHQMLEAWIAEARAHSLPSSKLERLRGALASSARVQRSASDRFQPPVPP